MSLISVHGSVVAFADGLLALDLPELPPDRRADVVAFTGRRIEQLPSPLRFGVSAIAVSLGALGRVVGTGRLAGFLARHSVPGLGEYVRLLRSLAFAYVWETWPGTRPDGAPA